MTSTYQYGNAAEERQHLDAIQRIAQDLDMRVEEIREIYEEFLGGVKQQAKIKDYLIILVSRQVKDAIRNRGLPTA